METENFVFFFQSTFKKIQRKATIFIPSKMITLNYNHTNPKDNIESPTKKSPKKTCDTVPCSKARKTYLF